MDRLGTLHWRSSNPCLSPKGQWCTGSAGKGTGENFAEKRRPFPDRPVAVPSVRWGIRSDRSEEANGKASALNDFCLLSSSFDFTVCVWKADLETSVWSVESTLGAMQGNKHAYYGAQFL